MGMDPTMSFDTGEHLQDLRQDKLSLRKMTVFSFKVSIATVVTCCVCGTGTYLGQERC